MQIRYRLTPDSAIRAVYARGIARPDAYQLVPYVTEDSAASPIAVSIGNPALRPEHANNYDLLYETFLHPLGMIQAGVFVKQLTAPQLLTTIPGGLTSLTFRRVTSRPPPWPSSSSIPAMPSLNTSMVKTPSVWF